MNLPTTETTEVTAPEQRGRKRKVSLSLDADLVAALQARGRRLSPQVNDAIRAELERRPPVNGQADVDTDDRTGAGQ